MNLVQIAENLYIHVEAITSIRPGPRPESDDGTPRTRVCMGADVVDFAADIPTVIGILFPSTTRDPMFSVLNMPEPEG